MDQEIGPIDVYYASASQLSLQFMAARVVQRFLMALERRAVSFEHQKKN